MKKIRKNLVHAFSWANVFTLSVGLCAGLCSSCGKQSDQQATKENDTSSAIQKKESIKSYYKESDFEELFTEKGKEIIAHFDGIMTYKEVLEDVSEIDLAYNPEFDKSKYTEKVVKEEEDEYKHNQYCDGDTVVYELYDGYSEDSYTHYTKTKNGLDAKVDYFEEEFAEIEKYHTITISTKQYVVTFANPEVEKPEEKQINIGLIKKEGDEFPELLSYALVDGHVILETADYRTEEGYMTYNGWLDDDGKTICEAEDSEYENLSDVDISESLKKIKAYDGGYKIHALMGPHSLINSDDRWYINVDLFMIFDTIEAAEKYATSIGLDKESISQCYLEEDAKQYHVECQKVTLPLSKSFTADGKDINEFVAGIFEDWTFRILTFNEKDEVESIGYGDGLILTVG